MFNHPMIALSNPLQFDEQPSVPKAEHLQKCVHAKAHNKPRRIVFHVLSQRPNKTENVYIFICMQENEKNYPPDPSPSRTIFAGGSDMPIYDFMTNYLIDSTTIYLKMLSLHNYYLSCAAHEH